MFSLKKVLFPTLSTVDLRPTRTTSRTKKYVPLSRKANKAKSVQLRNGKYAKIALAGGILADIQNNSSSNNNASRRPKRQRDSRPLTTTTSTQNTGSVLMNLDKRQPLENPKKVTPPPIPMDTLVVVGTQEQPALQTQSEIALTVKGNSMNAPPAVPIRRRASKRLMKQARRGKRTRVAPEASGKTVLPKFGDSLLQCANDPIPESSTAPRAKAQAAPQGDILMTLMEPKPNVNEKTNTKTHQHGRTTKAVPTKAAASKTRKMTRQTSKTVQSTLLDKSIVSIVLGKGEASKRAGRSLAKELTPEKTIQPFVSQQLTCTKELPLVDNTVESTGSLRNSNTSSNSPVVNSLNPTPIADGVKQSTKVVSSPEEIQDEQGRQIRDIERNQQQQHLDKDTVSLGTFTRNCTMGENTCVAGSSDDIDDNSEYAHAERHGSSAGLLEEKTQKPSAPIMATPGENACPHNAKCQDSNVPSVVKLDKPIEMSAIKTTTTGKLQNDHASPGFVVTSPMNDIIMATMTGPSPGRKANGTNKLRRSRRLSAKQDDVQEASVPVDNGKAVGKIISQDPDICRNANDIGTNLNPTGNDVKNPEGWHVTLRRSTRRTTLSPVSTARHKETQPGTTLEPNQNANRPSSKRKPRASSTQKYSTGTTVLKKFRTGWFEGTVVSYDHQSQYYKIEYEDGDEEEVEEHELAKILKLNVVGPENTPSQYSIPTMPSDASTDSNDLGDSPFYKESTNTGRKKGFQVATKKCKLPEATGSDEDYTFNATPSLKSSADRGGKSKDESTDTGRVDTALASISNPADPLSLATDDSEDDIFNATPIKKLFGNKSAKVTSKLDTAKKSQETVEPSRSLQRKRQAPKRFGVFGDNHEEATPTNAPPNRKLLVKKTINKRSSKQSARQVRISSEGTNKKPKICIADDDDALIWKPSELQALFSSHKTIDPKSMFFWEEVSELVITKTAEECRDKWFSLALTPAMTKRQQTTKRSLIDIAFDDDIFNATPMRGVLDPICDKDKVAGPNLSQSNQIDSTPNNQGIKVSCEGEIDGSIETANEIVSLQPKGYKMFIQKMGQCVRRKEPKAKKGRKKEAKMNKHFSEWDGEGDVEVNGRLSPGGTLHVKTHGDEDDNEFLNYFDDGESIDEETM
jgi:hypothetical protein